MNYRVFPCLLLPLALELGLRAGSAGAFPPGWPPRPSPSPRWEMGAFLAAKVQYRRSQPPYQLPASGAPRWSGGGAARGGCTVKEAPLIPLMPVETQLNAQTGQEPSFFAIATSERPTFFAYVPQTEARQIDFLLLDEKAGAVLYQKPIQISGQPQIISVQLDSSVPPLKAGVNYRWSFATICHPNDESKDTSGNPYIEGLLQRVELAPAAQQQLQQTAVRDRPKFYAEKGFWLDALTALAQLRCSAPADPFLKADWADLIRAIELTKIPELSHYGLERSIANAPLQPCNPSN